MFVLELCINTNNLKLLHFFYIICIECKERRIYKVNKHICIDCDGLFDICRYCLYGIAWLFMN